jgi:uncharacterized membrane protein YgaE (UPF0421/DUF939 family)
VWQPDTRQKRLISAGLFGLLAFLMAVFVTHNPTLAWLSAGTLILVLLLLVRLEWQRGTRRQPHL